MPARKKPTRTYGKKPIIFSFEENGEQYMIGSEVYKKSQFRKINKFSHF